MAPSFVADRMLGRLCRWIRLLGYSCIYPPEGNESDLWLIKTAKAKKAHLITRDVQLASRYKRSILLETDNSMEQLSIIVSKFSLNTKDVPARARCPNCNSTLSKVKKGAISGLVPKTHRLFWQCKRCKKVYWKGGHWTSMKNALRRAKLK